ncbi:iron-sulfur cluster assembly accessory protein [Buchnera aphidicola]|uniref:Iron-sulfur cluster assembly accessory protein n=1 Tax=Buchnera aphidicola (Stegophylla sp.) TaxID=2315800 RepID=A0A4D6YIQ8_9GAMM|nr:iron-sulfur cluster assembly accessory protein [Buchnera aphidicola (Stegophylla sp.)]QCI26271.1 iron-sulfur cluster assembly accessory protein [Buchnera aphidicola (Stegophylla sp.)]
MKNKKIWKGITITDKAKKQIQYLIKKNKHVQSIQINIKKSGCAGFRYYLSLISDTKKIFTKKYYIYNKYNIIIQIPIKYMHIIDGTTIDFIKEDGINMKFKFNNPHVQQFCGCGESFNINTNNQKI